MSVISLITEGAELNGETNSKRSRHEEESKKKKAGKMFLYNIQHALLYLSA